MSEQATSSSAAAGSGAVQWRPKGKGGGKGKGKGAGRDGVGRTRADGDDDWRGGGGKSEQRGSSTWVPVGSSEEATADSQQDHRQGEDASGGRKGKSGKGNDSKGKGKSKQRSKGKGKESASEPMADGGDVAPEAYAEEPKGKGKQRRKGKGQEGAREPRADAGDVPPEAFAEAPVRRNRPSKQSKTARDTAATVTERLVEQLGRGSYECMICISKVARAQPIWSCDQCWAAFHLKCINQWIRRSSDTDGPEFAWACPGCRYHRVATMPEYTCFCTKLLEPEQNPHWLAHSCGEVCEKDRGCPHKCPELCHPGPCPRCTAVGGPGSCHCGREASETTRCGDSRTWSCGKPCGRELSCGIHTCPARCHPGPCPPCAVTSLEPCYCGAREERRLCGQGSFSCTNPCGRVLECGEHFCERLCHPGDCGPCPKDPERWGDRCACGKSENCSREGAKVRLIQWVGVRTRCSQRLPLCSEPCGRPNESCGHPCRKLCHEGPCGACEKKVQRECRCSRTKREVVCSEGQEVKCNQVCRTKKTCGNHRCDVVCCSGFNNRSHEAHMCLQVCGKPLSCGNHVCEDFCHLGKCAPCRIVLHEPVFCACGANSIDPPVVCGRSLPYCEERCGQEMDCGHSCPARCHPGEHPLCYELVTRRCLGGHREMYNQRCHIGAISCGQTCGQRLPCRHSCSSQCHAGDCPPCSQACGARRLHCDHTCEATCHPGTQCEDVPCRKKIKQSCPCGLRVEERVCGAFSGNRRPSHAAPRCTAFCERQPFPKLSQPGEPVKYTADLFQLAAQHRRYVQTLEDRFAAILASAGQGASTAASSAASSRLPSSAPSPTALPPCDSNRRLLAVEYARLHWRLKTVSKADSSEGWWVVQVLPSATARLPRPLLSEIAGSSSSAAAAHLLPALGSQPCLRFSGLKGPGDEVYDLAGHEGLMGIRPSQRAGEVIVFMDKSSFAATAFKRLTGGQAPSSEPTPIRSSSGWAQPGGPSTSSGLRVALEQTLSMGPSSHTGPLRPPSSAAPAKSTQDAWDTPKGDAEEVPDDWETDAW